MPIAERKTAPAVAAAPRVSVVIPTYKRTDLLIRCLHALIRQDFPGLDYEIVVCDDAASDETRSVVSDLAARTPVRIRYERVPGPHGPAAARNVGWRSAAAPIIAFTDDDTVPDRRWLREGIEALESGADAAWGRLEMPLPPDPTDYELNASGLSRSVFVTANCFCRASMLKDIGGFDERFTKAWREDSDLFFRILKTGRNVAHAESARVLHPVRPAGWGVSVLQQKNNLFEALLYKKHPALYRAKLKERVPWSYYLTAACLAGSIGMSAAGRKFWALTLGAGWAALTGEFLWRRLRNSSRKPSHLFEMVATSIVIPPIAIYWRLRGAIRYRTWFL